MGISESEIEAYLHSIYDRVRVVNQGRLFWELIILKEE